MRHLLQRCLGGHWWLVRINSRLDEDGPACRKRLAQGFCAKLGIVDAEPGDAKAPRHRRKVNRLQIAGIFRIAKKDHLLPFDLSEAIVLDDDDLDVEAIFHTRG